MGFGQDSPKTMRRGKVGDWAGLQGRSLATPWVGITPQISFGSLFFALLVNRRDEVDHLQNFEAFENETSIGSGIEKPGPGIRNNGQLTILIMQVEVFAVAATLAIQKEKLLPSQGVVGMGNLDRFRIRMVQQCILC